MGDYAKLLSSFTEASRNLDVRPSAESKEAFNRALEEIIQFEQNNPALIESIPSVAHLLPDNLFGKRSLPLGQPKLQLAFVAAIAILVTAIGITFRVLRQDTDEIREPLLVADANLVPVAIVLEVDGNAQYRRAGWSKSQSVNPGAQLEIDDTVTLPADSTLTVICPDGTLQMVTGQDLSSDQSINCPSVNAPEALFAETTNQTARQRASQDLTRPILLNPRGTVVRTSTIDVRWNTLPDTQAYAVNIFSDSDTIYESGVLSQSNLLILVGGVASINVKLEFQANTPSPYTVQVCAFAENRQPRCSSQDLSSPEISHFYYYESPQLDQAEALLSSKFEGRNPEELLYARAVLLSGPLYEPLIREARADENGEIVTPAIYGPPIGYYAEALDLLSRIISEYPNSNLVQSSPDFYILRGTLFERIGLTQQAFNAYERATELTQPSTLAAAVATFGKANNAPTRDSIQKYYNEALTHYDAFLNADELDELCQEIGIEHCQAWRNQAP